MDEKYTDLPGTSYMDADADLCFLFSNIQEWIMLEVDFQKYDNLIEQTYEKHLGKIAKVVGLTMESIGPDAKLNDLCVVSSKDGNHKVNAEVVGFRDNRILLMPFDDVEGI